MHARATCVRAVGGEAMDEGEQWSEREDGSSTHFTILTHTIFFVCFLKKKKKKISAIRWKGNIIIMTLADE